LFVGTLSYRKGMFDLAMAARTLPRERFVFRVVGPRVPETDALLRTLGDHIELVPKVPYSKLRAEYDWGDLYILPTIEDGFAITLAQARANALPILSTYNSGAPDMIQDGITGWLVPIRSPVKLMARLRACDAQRAELAAMVEHIANHSQPRTWDDVARDFEAACEHGRRGGA
jgi:glycosyltransferase involved in cell wall biosynthesis